MYYFSCRSGLGIHTLSQYGSSKEKADLKNYYGISDKNELGVTVNNKVIKNSDGNAVGRLIDGEAYVEYSVVRDYINERFIGTRMRTLCYIHYQTAMFS